MGWDGEGGMCGEGERGRDGVEGGVRTLRRLLGWIGGTLWRCRGVQGRGGGESRRGEGCGGRGG